MILGMTYYQICWYFVIYSFIGWCLEVIFHAVTIGKIINRGFLNGPVCPVYGFGMLGLFGLAGVAVPSGIMQMSNGMLFVSGLIIATSVELIAGWILDRIFHARWWDYSDKPFNLHGYICVEFSLLWGIGTIIVIRVAHPIVNQVSVDFIPERIGWWMLLVLYAAYIADACVTVAILNGLNKRLKELDRLRKSMRIVSDSMSNQIGTGAMKTAQVIGETRVQSALAKAELRDAMVESKEQMAVRSAELRDAVRSKGTEMLESAQASSQAMLQQSIQRTEDAYRQSHELTGAAREKYEHLRDELETKMQQTLEVMRKTRFFGEGRLLNAFPDVVHRDYGEALRELKRRVVAEIGHKDDDSESTNEGR